MKLKTLIFLIVLLPALLLAQVITDTLWWVPQLDGGIAYRPGSGIFNMSTSGTDIGPGDGFDLILQGEVFSRSFLAFDISSLSASDTINIIQAAVGVYQFDCTGNDQPHVYHIWNVAGGDTHFCVLDHIDYGNSLDLGDWTAGDPGDPQTLQTNIGIISDGAAVEYKTLDVTPYVVEDINNGKTHSQYRVRFTLDRDFDLMGDFLIAISGDSPMYKPYLVVTYEPVNTIENENIIPINFALKQNYPNPFNPMTHINYQLPKMSKVKLDIFNILGQKIKTLVNKHQAAGYYTIEWNGLNNDGKRVGSGI